MVKFTKSKKSTSGPSSAIGVMRFFDAESKSPKLTPKFIIAVSIVFIIIMLALKLITPY